MRATRHPAVPSSGRLLRGASVISMAGLFGFGQALSIAQPDGLGEWAPRRSHLRLGGRPVLRKGTLDRIEMAHQEIELGEDDAHLLEFALEIGERGGLARSGPT